MQHQQRLVLVGKIHGASGLRGEVKVESFTDPEPALLRYQPWILRDARGGEHEITAVRARKANKGLVVSLPGVTDRESAESLCGAGIWVPRTALPPLHPGEFYWVDMEGLHVTTVDGVALGTVAGILPTGANDVLVVQGERERMIPFIRPDTIVSVDLDAGLIVVDWDPEF